MRIVINILAGWRLMRLVQLDSITENWRNSLWDWLSVNKRLKSLRTLLECPWCLSMWIAAFVYLGMFFGGVFWDVISEVLALSAVIGFLSWLDHEKIGG